MGRPSFAGVKAVFFDFMGTCLDWHSGIVEALPARLEVAQRRELAIAWREAFFEDIHARFEKRMAPEDIDISHSRLLEMLVGTGGTFAATALTEEERETAVKAWHRMKAWPDVAPALTALRRTREVFVLANGTARLQLDLARSSGLEFDLLFSSELLGLTKPNPELYRKALRLVGVAPEESVMVAAHAYDLRAAKGIGMKTVYVRRWSEDTREDMDQVKADVDVFIGEVSDGDGDFSQLVELLT
ncbi:(S)-2-haloacid dehalogenase IVA [Thozetella sp. PMI_491]|nr:(S)-2-haloacid dehalogenase IVA [Thozetella sp. PMI_491]